MPLLNAINPKGAPDKVSRLVGAATVLALLYFAREFLIPVTLAFVLSLLIAPAIRRLRRFGLGPTASVLLAVLTFTLVLGALGLAIGVQVIRMADSLPQYEQTMRGKLSALNELAVGRIGQADRVMDGFDADPTPAATSRTLNDPGISAAPTTPLQVEVHQPPLRPFQLVQRVLASAWGPLETTGIVFVVLIFVLLEHEAIRDRFIRLVGKHDLRATTLAVNDAGARLSRFFVSQALVNVSVGVLVGLGLLVVGVPQALLWGAMATLLRFIPYVGIWIAAFCATLLAAAIVPGWSLAVMTLGLFFAVELMMSQVVEPQLYGHTTGLSPLSVVIAAIFWSWIWGPVGLVLSTPLTLCLVVAARYIDALNFLEVLLGDLPALTLPENFYQRALAGDDDEIVANARRYVKRKSFSAYCDSVLIPAMYLARMDFSQRAITKAEQLKVSRAISSVLHVLGEDQKWWKRNPRESFLEDLSLGRHLRNERERLFGEWQGPLDAPAGSVVLCIALTSQPDELTAEILVRVLRAQHIDARHLSLEDLEEELPPEADPRSVAMICVVSTDPANERMHFDAVSLRLRERLGTPRLMAVLMVSPFDTPEGQPPDVGGVDVTVRSFQEAVQSTVDAMAKATAAAATA